MKRQSYLNRNSHDRGGNAAVIWAIVVVVIVAIIFIVRFALPGVFFAAASPFWTLGSSLSAQTASLTAGFSNKQKLAAENSALATQNSALKNENAVLTARAQDLTKLLGGATNANQSSEQLPAGVLAHPPESPYDTLIIDAGASDGVLIGALVYAPGGIPIGSVKHVTSDTAQVSLYTSPGHTIDGWIGADRVPITLAGAGAGAFTASLPEAAPISVGDTVYAPGPGALPIGTLVKINTDPSSPSETLNIQPYVDLFSITWVEVDRNGT